MPTPDDIHFSQLRGVLKRNPGLRSLKPKQKAELREAFGSEVLREEWKPLRVAAAKPVGFRELHKMLKAASCTPEQKAELLEMIDGQNAS